MTGVINPENNIAGVKKMSSEIGEPSHEITNFSLLTAEDSETRLCYELAGYWFLMW
ncbi:hypothetical protein [Nissabacter sp. SGAir0207]|uniref:hypothetical protein n=1 Tax=Nissabacter sp. SGAir0207 TaxID=2126321 RepID=UPI00143D2707|nr:hypothetical protein [Nissabacter sp. SGAir0207]